MDPDLIRRWGEEGQLPHLQKLIAQGVSGDVTLPPGFATHAMWPSFFTGTSPARHGWYYDRQLVRGGYRAAHPGISAIKRRPFWEALSRQGRRVAVLNVPKAPLAERLNGVQLVSWGTHDYEYPEVQSQPPGLAAEIVARFGPDPLGHCDAFDRDPGSRDRFRRGLRRRVETAAEIACHVLAQGDWDLFVVGISDAHCAGHQLWDLHERGDGDGAPSSETGLTDPVKEVYRAIDSAVGRLVSLTGALVPAMVFAGPGMGSYYPVSHVLDDVLLAHENVARPARSVGSAAPGSSNRWIDHARSIGRTLTPPVVRRRLQPLVARLNETEAAWDLGWRSCFVLPHHETHGAIRVNLEGREPKGRISPASYDDYCGALARYLEGLENADTGEKLVRRVIRTHSSYPGEYLKDLPDLMVEWRRSAPVFRVRAPEIGTIDVAADKTYLPHRSGDHKLDSMLIASGPAFDDGGLPDRIAMTDLAPTIASLIGADLTDVDGRPLTAPCFGPR